MKDRIYMLDYSFDWYLDQRYVHDKPEPGPLSREDIVEFCGTLGVGGIELLHAYWSDCSTAYLKRITAGAGLRIASYIFAADLAQPAAARRAAVDHVFRMLDRTAELGAPFAMLHPAQYKEGLPLEQQQAGLVEGLRECAGRAAELGLLLVSENIDDPPIRVFMGRGAQCRDICAQVGSPAFRLIYDAGAALFVDEDPLETLKVMAPYIVHVHLKNNRPPARGEQPARYRDSVGGRRYTGAVLNGGVIDLKAILAELDRLGYSGPFNIEYQGEDDPRTAIKHNIDYLVQLLDS